MLHAKFQDHKTSDSGEDFFERFLPYIGVESTTKMIFTKFMFPLPKKAPH